MQRDDAYFLDMLLAAHDAMAFTSSLTFLEFETSRLHQNAVVKAIEIIGEAASRVSKNMQSVHPQIPWAEIIGMRNRLVHGYGDIQLDVVWQTVQDDLPNLVAQLEPLVPAAPR